jgi:hypothetical protein
MFLFKFSMNVLKLRGWICLIFVLGSLIACSNAPNENPVETALPIDSAPPLQEGQIRQWAAGAEASSEFSNDEWSALQAVGAPDTPRCGDYQTAWATAGSDTVETLVLTYTLSVRVTGINVIQSFNPNQVIQVDLVGAFGRTVPVYEAEPVQVDQPCPYTLVIPIEKTEGRYDRIQITVDQSVLGLGWNQIDAVELIGDPE